MVTTHYMEEAERLCDRIGIIDQGRIIAEGTRRELVSLIGEKDRVVLSINGDSERVRQDGEGMSLCAVLHRQTT